MLVHGGERRCGIRGRGRDQQSAVSSEVHRHEVVRARELAAALECPLLFGTTAPPLPQHARDQCSGTVGAVRIGRWRSLLRLGGRDPGRHTRLDQIKAGLRTIGEISAALLLRRRAGEVPRADRGVPSATRPRRHREPGPTMERRSGGRFPGVSRGGRRGLPGCRTR